MILSSFLVCLLMSNFLEMKGIISKYRENLTHHSYKNTIQKLIRNCIHIKQMGNTRKFFYLTLIFLIQINLIIGINSQSVDTDFMSEDLLQVLKSQYKLFFQKPFTHESLMKNHLTQQVKQMIGDRFEQNSNQMNALQRSISLLYMGRHEQSYKEIKKYLQSSEKQQIDSEELLYSRFLHLRLLDRLSQFNQGLQNTQKYIKQIQINGKQAHFYFYHMLGNFLMHHLKYIQAVQQFKKSIKLQPYQQEFLFTYYNIALCLQKVDKSKDALTYMKHVYQHAKDKGDLTAQIANTLGYNYYNLGKAAHQPNADIHHDAKDQSKIRMYWDKAELYFKESIEINQNYFLPYFNLATLKLDQNYRNQAQKLYRKVLEIDPSVKSAVYGLFKATYSKESRVQSFKILDMIKNRTPQVLLQMGIILHENGQDQEALKKVQEGLKKVEHKDLLEWKGAILNQLGKNLQAEKAYKRTIQLGNKKAYVFFNLGLVQKQLQKYIQALDSFITADNLEPRQQTKKQIEQIRKILKGQQL